MKKNKQFLYDYLNAYAPVAQETQNRLKNRLSYRQTTKKINQININKMKIKQFDGCEHKVITRAYIITDDFITTKVIIYANVYDDGQVVCTESSKTFHLLGQSVKEIGFKKLYEDLFGENTFKAYTEKIIQYAQDTVKEEFKIKTKKK